MNSSLGVIDPLTSGYIDLSFSFHTQLSNTTEWVLRMEETAVSCSMTYFLNWTISFIYPFIELKIVLYFPCDPGYDEASLALRRSQTE